MTTTTRTYSDTTEDRYYEMLGVLPPAAYAEVGTDGIAFLVGEPVTHRPCTLTGRLAATYDAFFHLHGVYRVADEPMTIKEFKAVTVAEVFESLTAPRGREAGGA